MAQPAMGPAPADGPCPTPPEGAVHPVDEKLPASRLVPAALQHIAAMYAGVVTPPLIIGQAVGLDTAGQTRLIAASLLIAGLATVLQTLGIANFAGNRLPFVNAASSAGIAPMLAIAETSAKGHQLPAIYGAVMVAGSLLPPGRPLLRPAAALLPAAGDRCRDHAHRRHADARARLLGPGRRQERRRLRVHEEPGARRLHARRDPALPALRPRLPASSRPAARPVDRNARRDPVRAWRTSPP